MGPNPALEFFQVLCVPPVRNPLTREPVLPLIVIVDVVMPTVGLFFFFKYHLCFICGFPWGLKKKKKKAKQRQVSALISRVFSASTTGSSVGGGGRRHHFCAGEGEPEVKSPGNVMLSFMGEMDGSVSVCSGCFRRSRGFGTKKATTSSSRALHVPRFLR